MVHRFISSDVPQLAQGQRVPVPRRQSRNRMVSGRSHPCPYLVVCSPLWAAARAGRVRAGAHSGCDFSSLCPFTLCSQGAQIKGLAEDIFASIKLNILVFYLNHKFICLFDLCLCKPILRKLYFLKTDYQWNHIWIFCFNQVLNSSITMKLSSLISVLPALCCLPYVPWAGQWPTL